MPKCPQCGIDRVDLHTPCSICGSKNGLQSQGHTLSLSFPQEGAQKPLPVAANPAHVHTSRTEVVVTDIKMPFGSMVAFMIKWALAAIPAFIILAGLWFLVTVFSWEVAPQWWGTHYAEPEYCFSRSDSQGRNARYA